MIPTFSVDNLEVTPAMRQRRHMLMAALYASADRADKASEAWLRVAKFAECGVTQGAV